MTLEHDVTTRLPLPASPSILTTAEFAIPQSPTVLLVDDQAIIGAIIGKMLSKIPGISFYYCSKAADALAMATELQPTVILQGLVLADGDGLDLVASYRANAATAAIPIIVLSAEENAVVKSKAFGIGANDYMIKLPDGPELVARVRYHSQAFLSGKQRDQAYLALEESQQQMDERNATLTLLNGELNRFVGMAAHDLRSPLGLVNGLADFLVLHDAESLSEQQLDFLKTIRNSTEFMLRLVNDLLDVAKIEEGRLDLALQETDVAAHVEECVALSRILAHNKEIAIHIEAESGLPKVMLDPHRMQQVLTNLLTNAIKYSHSGTRIDVRIHSDGDEVVVAVRDHGQGIPSAELGRLFMPFSVTSVQGTAGEKSTGLGLLIVKKVIEAHRGRIWVESEVGQGSTFFVSLPK